MRILHFNQFGRYAGGVESYIADVSRALALAGHEAQLISIASEPPNGLMPGTLQVIAPNLKATLSGIDGMIADFLPDVAYMHALYDPLIVRWICGRLPAIRVCAWSLRGLSWQCALLAPIISRRADRAAGLGCLVNAQIQHCCFGHNPTLHVRRLRRVRSLLEATSRVDVLVGSEFMRRRLVANGLPGQRVSVLAPFLVEAPVAEYRPARDPTAILFGGRLTVEKGLRQLIAALKSVQTEWHLIVAGDGPDRASCERLAERLDLVQRIEFVGWVEPTQMETLYQHCAFAVMPSLWPEPYGRIGPEAFVHGRPVVAYDVGGIPDWLEDGETGYLVASGDVNGRSWPLRG